MEIFLLILLGISSSWATNYPNTSTYSVSMTPETHILKRVEPKSQEKNIQNVVLSNLQISGIDIVAFDHLMNVHVKNLDLSNNKLQQFEELTFYNLIELETLSLANNEFRSLGRSYFVGLDTLKILDLSNNHLTELTRTNLLGLPVSANVIMTGMTLMSLRVDELDHSKMFPSQDDMSSYPWNIPSFEPHYGKFSMVLPFEPDESGHKIAFPKNSIREITPELLNNLHEDVIIVDLREQGLMEIKKDVIRNSNIRRIQLNRNRLKKIEDDAFKNTKLVSLSLISNELDDFDFVETLPMSMLELSVAANRIKDISGGFGHRLKRLVRLIISHNAIKNICSCAFRGLKVLREIDLSHNFIEEIHENLFRDQEILSIIILSNNKIRTLSPGIFRNIRNAMKIDLNNNEIMKIYRDSFLGLRNYPVFTIDLRKNKIDRIEAGSFANMTVQELVLDDNRISENSIDKGAFESCTIGDLTLHKNLFTEINADAFYGIRVYHSIGMHSNQIKSIGRDSMKYMIDVPELNLGNNPIERIESGSFYRTRVILQREVKIVEGGAFNRAGSVVKSQEEFDF